MNYNCDLIKDLLPLYYDKAASDFSSKAIEEHLKECDECRRFYQAMEKSANIPFKPVSKSDGEGGYASLAKRLRRAKWYWRFCVSFLMGIVVALSLMYSEGYRFDPMKAAYASNLIDTHSQPVTTVPMGNERILYIYEQDGLYQNIDVIHQFLSWKYVPVWPSRHIGDPGAMLQLVERKAYANSDKNSLYIICAVAVNDSRVACIDLGKEGSMQRQNVTSKMTVFFWDETGNWDSTDTWDGMISDSELRGTAYADDGTVLYRLTLDHAANGQEYFLWVAAE